MKTYITLFLALLAITAFSQQPNTIDSLKAEFKKPDTDKFAVANLLAWEFAKSNPDSLDYYNKLSLKYIKDDVQKGKYHVLIGAKLFFDQKTDSSVLENNIAIGIAQKHNDFKTLSSAFNTLCKIQYQKGDFIKSEQYSKKSLDFSLKTNDSKLILKSYINYGSVQITNDKLEEGISTFQLAEKYFTGDNQYEQASLFSNLGSAYTGIKDYKNAIKYLQKAEKIFAAIKNEVLIFNTYHNLSENFVLLKDPENAEIYLAKAMGVAKTEHQKTDVYFTKAQLYYNTGKYDLAESYLSKSIIIDLDYNILKAGEDYFLMGQINNAKKNFSKADGYFLEAIKIMKENEETRNLGPAYSDIIRNYFQKKGLSEYVTFFDGMIEFSKADYEKEKVKSLLELDTKYKTADNLAQIKTQQLQLANEKAKRNIAFSGIVFILLVSSGGFVWYKNKQKQKALQTQNTLLGLQQNINTMELQNLNQQLDPHEIKNLLASISPEIQTKAPESYRQMIKLFNLTKASLNSKSITESIENQVQQINDFLSLEKNMLSVPLNYSINNSVENAEIQIPRLILKNLVENSVKHGIKGQANGGNISVNISEVNGMIHIEVDDTGMGRKNLISLDSGIGTSTYQKLFATLNQSNKEKATFLILDKEQGTKVEVSIPTDYKYS